MTSTIPGSPVQAAPTPPLFSYAQAAKGRATATTAAASSVLSNQSTSGISTPAKDTNSAINTPPASVNGATASSEIGERIVNGSYDAVTKSDPLGVGMDSESKSTTLVNSGSIPGSPSFGTASTSTLPKEEDLTSSTTTQPDSVWDRISTVNGMDKAGESPDGRRSKKGKKQKNAEKEAEKEAEKQKEEEKKLELLVAAPPPAVNIWQQRKEAQALKVKPSPPITQSPQAFLEATSVNELNPKTSESKKRAKNAMNDDGDKSSSTAQTGVAKDSSNTGKGQKKISDSLPKGKDDSSSKRTAPRGSRVIEKEEKPASQLPPPVEDATSWPTPETALEEEKRKALEREKSEKDKEREERDETVSNKPRPKEKWVAVPYVPTVNFNTPLPPRGGRGRGGARGGRENTGRGNHAANGGSNGERVNNSSVTAASPVSEENRGRGGSTTVRAASLPPNSSNKRQSSHTRPQGKPPTITNDKSKAAQASSPSKNESAVDTHRVSATQQLEQSLDNQQPNRGQNTRGSKSEFAQGSSNDNILRSGAGDRKSEPNLRGSDQFKDGSNFGKDSGQARERTDGRVDRGRGGGFRGGRGGHSNFPNGQQSQPIHAFANGHGPQPVNGYPARQNSIPYSPPMTQSPFSNPYVQAPMRGGRGGSRSQSIPNNAMYGRFPPNMHPQMAPLQTQNGIYDYQQQPLQTMSAGPYASYPEHFQLLAMVTMQLEYYFSIDNLCKDVYLRKHMDSQGFVFLAFIAGFKRIQALTGEIEMLRFACRESNKIEIVKGDDGIDRLRKKDGWDQWVVSMEERDESVRTSGPSGFLPLDSSAQQAEQAQQMGFTQAPYHMGMSPPQFSPTNTESHFPSPYMNESQFAPANGNVPLETPLSAAVPVFSPSQPKINGASTDAGAIDRLDEETTFRNEDVANLALVFKNGGPKAGASFHSSSSRTFSNGSIDGRSIAEELHDDPRQGRGLTNGSRVSEISPDGLRRSRSPFTPISPTKSDINNSPTVMWVKGQRQQAPIRTDNTDELYTSVRAKALRMRETTPIGETHPLMKQLYEFWSHFLCRNFNPTMYLEFRQYAREDAETKAMVGMRNLISYYDETLNNKKKVIPDTLARHYIEIVNLEKISTAGPLLDRPAFTKLRLAWRNGALDMKSRKKIDNLVGAALREELER